MKTANKRRSFSMFPILFIISLPSFIHIVAGAGKKNLKCIVCNWNENCTRVKKCGTDFEDFAKGLLDFTTGDKCDFNGNGTNDLGPFVPGGGGGINPNEFFRSTNANDSSVNGTAGKSNSTGRQLPFNPLFFYECGRFEKDGKVIRKCVQSANDRGKTSCNKQSCGKCDYCDTDECNGSTKLRQTQNLWEIILLFSTLVTVISHFY